MPKGRFISPTAAAKELDCCARTLHRMRQRKELKKGVHWTVKNPTAIRLSYLYDPDQIRVFQNQVITEVPKKKDVQLRATQPALIDSVAPYGITAEGEAVEVN